MPPKRKPQAPEAPVVIETESTNQEKMLAARKLLHELIERYWTDPTLDEGLGETTVDCLLDNRSTDPAAQYLRDNMAVLIAPEEIPASAGCCPKKRMVRQVMGKLKEDLACIQVDYDVLLYHMREIKTLAALPEQWPELELPRKKRKKQRGKA